MAHDTINSGDNGTDGAYTQYYTIRIDNITTTSVKIMNGCIGSQRVAHRAIECKLVQFNSW